MTKKIKGRQIAQAETPAKQKQLIKEQERQKAAAQQQQEDFQAAVLKNTEDMKAAFKEIGNTAAGQKVLKFIYASCNPRLDLNQQIANREVKHDLLVINRARADMWNRFATLLPLDVLAMVEYDLAQKPVLVMTDEQEAK